ncbi:hypothetical protein DPMN_168998 [Dreissena polymorpha]|uniref:Uncharacterized protein n=1 Tax=Dreissena polymorpha TaxID=45954 RepID=A0A9D4IWG2_DREPO|nr:hypothetical protein DPMN_168998 [Dreissena polymorpha]
MHLVHYIVAGTTYKHINAHCPLHSSKYYIQSHTCTVSAGEALVPVYDVLQTALALLRVLDVTVRETAC